MTPDQTERLRARLKRVANLTAFIRIGGANLPSRRTIERFRAGGFDTLPAHLASIAYELRRQRPKLYAIDKAIEKEMAKERQE